MDLHSAGSADGEAFLRERTCGGPGRGRREPRDEEVGEGCDAELADVDAD